MPYKEMRSGRRSANGDGHEGFCRAERCASFFLTSARLFDQVKDLLGKGKPHIPVCGISGHAVASS